MIILYKELFKDFIRKIPLWICLSVVLFLLINFFVLRDNNPNEKIYSQEYLFTYWADPSRYFFEKSLVQLTNDYSKELIRYNYFVTWSDPMKISVETVWKPKTQLKVIKQYYSAVEDKLQLTLYKGTRTAQLSQLYRYDFIHKNSIKEVKETKFKLITLIKDFELYGEKLSTNVLLNELYLENLNLYETKLSNLKAELENLSNYIVSNYSIYYSNKIDMYEKIDDFMQVSNFPFFYTNFFIPSEIQYRNYHTIPLKIRYSITTIFSLMMGLILILFYMIWIRGKYVAE